MSYFISINTNLNFERAIELTTRALNTEGLGIITIINIKDTIKEKLGVDFKNYTILGACDPHFAYKALQIDDKIGSILPCNVSIIQQDSGMVEISAMDPTTALNIIENEELQPFALEIKQKLLRCMTYIDDEKE